MRNLKRINEEISRTKKLMNIKEYSQVYDNYSNVNFKDFVVSGCKPSQDAINPALLQDVQTAAKNAGVNVDITTAVSGHKSLPSRHPSGNAVDIAIINGKSVSSSNRGDVDKFVAELTRMGYVKNREVGNPKAVLTFGFPGHDTHVHVSNTSGSPVKGIENLSEPDGTASTAAASAAVTAASSTGGASTGSDSTFRGMLGHTDSQQIAPDMKGTIDALNSVKEEKVYSNFGRDILKSSNDFKLPQNKNHIIKSPIDGVIENYSRNKSCKNPISIKHIVDREILYLEYCGIDNPIVSSGNRVSKGTKLGETNSDVTISLYNITGSKLSIKSYEDKETTNNSEELTNKKPNNYSEKPSLSHKKSSNYSEFTGNELSHKKSKYHSEFPTELLKLPFKALSKAAKSIKNKIPILKDLKSVTSKKVNEDIERIKRLLK